MKKLKLFLCVALFGAMSFGAFSAYGHLTMSDAERALLENVEALTSREGGGDDGHCVVDPGSSCPQLVVRPSGSSIEYIINKRLSDGTTI